MPRFSRLSRSRLESCDSRLCRILNEAIKTHDFTVICGHRTKEEQNECYRLGRSGLEWPLSKHNEYPSKAVDIAPYFPDVKIDWKDRAAFARLFGFIERIAQEKGVQLRWGADWDRDGRTRDHTFLDFPHIEIFEE